MSLKKEKEESAKNISLLRSICTNECSDEESMDLKKFYMNKYGNYMASRIVATIFIEFILMFMILNIGMDSLWDGIPYAETVIYGVLWGSGGIYLAHMLIIVIRDTYDLKLALEAGKVKKSTCDVTFHESLMYNDNKKNILKIYAKIKGKNEQIWFFTSKHKGMKYISNVGNVSPGTKLVVYTVDDKKHDLFVMLKDAPIGDSVDKMLKNIMSDNLTTQKLKLNMLKSQLKPTKKNKKK